MRVTFQGHNYSQSEMKEGYEHFTLPQNRVQNTKEALHEK